MKTLIAAATLAAFAIPASAQDTSLKIEHGDLDLSSAQGQKVLERRIDKAARQACGYGQRATGTRVRSGEAKECYLEIKARAHQQFAALRDEDGKGG